MEDDIDMLELLKKVFRDVNYDVIFFSIAPDNHDVQLLAPDLIFLDIRLKGSSHSGADICIELKADSSTMTIPVVLFSGEYNLAHIAGQCGANMYLAKPYNVLNLLSAVKKYLA